jgi:hypothetical protein
VDFKSALNKKNRMIGTLLNIATVLVGGSIGLLLGARLPDRLKKTVIAGIGLFTAAFGVKMFLETKNVLIVLGSLLVGALLGEWWKIEAGLQNLGRWLERHFSCRQAAEPALKQPPKGAESAASGSGALTTSSRFVHGLLTASIVFCAGPMTILGAIQDGLTGDYRLLATKAILDGFAALAFASSLGIGVLFSVLVILVYQGGITLLAAQFNSLITPAMTAEMTAVGGVILLAIAVSSLLEIKPIRVGSFLPALFIAPLIVAILGWLGIKP